MTEDRTGDGGKQTPANDNQPSDGGISGASGDPSQRLDAIVLSIARMIGRQLAREHFESLRAANDNMPPLHDDEGADDDDGR